MRNHVLAALLGCLAALTLGTTALVSAERPERDERALRLPDRARAAPLAGAIGGEAMQATPPTPTGAPFPTTPGGPGTLPTSSPIGTDVPNLPAPTLTAAPIGGGPPVTGDAGVTPTVEAGPAPSSPNDIFDGALGGSSGEGPTGGDSGTPPPGGPIGGGPSADAGGSPSAPPVAPAPPTDAGVSPPRLPGDAGPIGGGPSEIPGGSAPSLGPSPGVGGGNDGTAKPPPERDPGNNGALGAGADNVDGGGADGG